MLGLVLAAAFFVGIHLGIAGTSVRDRLAERLGERAYLGLFSAASLVGLIWLTTAYADAPYVPLWGPLPALRPLALPVVLVAVVFVVLGLTTPSPTVVGGEGALDAPEPATGIQRVTRHPFLWGVAVWATMHLVVTGNLRALVLFGTMLLLALAGPPSIDAKRARRLGPAWARYAAVTSNVPFAAIVQGRNQLRFDEIGWGRLAFAVAVFTALLLMHPVLFGANPLGFLAY
ncbi:MAG TPA: NnrU family protein [Candidatus Limnocylindria bacterium]|nr:NnrU family protein [Candidatus Limnocylindria bacterium]